MGYNKVILCLNDADSEVDADPVKWWQSVKNVFANGWTGRFPRFSSGWQAVWQQHADVVGVIFVGGNYATVFGSSMNGGMHSSEEEQIRILKGILKQKGYRISKIPNARNVVD